MALEFEPKISGTRVTGYGKIEPIFESQIISLQEVHDADLCQECMNWILDTLRFTKGEIGWWATMDWDTIYKLTIKEKYPELAEELTAYFGESWLNQYIRFNH